MYANLPALLLSPAAQSSRLSPIRDVQMQNHIDPKMMKRRGMIRLVISAFVSLGFT
jgi:hypothetical protein